jgi:hypothetical protein
MADERKCEVEPTLAPLNFMDIQWCTIIDYEKYKILVQQLFVWRKIKTWRLHNTIMGLTRFYPSTLCLRFYYATTELPRSVLYDYWLILLKGDFRNTLYENSYKKNLSKKSHKHIIYWLLFLKKLKVK